MPIQAARQSHASIKWQAYPNSASWFATPDSSKTHPQPPHRAVPEPESSTHACREWSKCVRSVAALGQGDKRDIRSCASSDHVVGRESMLYSLACLGCSKLCLIQYNNALAECCFGAQIWEWGKADDRASSSEGAKMAAPFLRIPESRQTPTDDDHHHHHHDNSGFRETFRLFFFSLLPVLPRFLPKYIPSSTWTKEEISFHFHVGERNNCVGFNLDRLIGFSYFLVSVLRFILVIKSLVKSILNLPSSLGTLLWEINSCMGRKEGNFPSPVTSSFSELWKMYQSHERNFRLPLAHEQLDSLG